MEIRVRHAVAADAGAIARLSQEAFRDTFAGDNTAADMEQFMNGPFRLDLLEAEVRNMPGEFLLAEAADCLAGYARIIFHAENSGAGGMEVSRLYADSHFIGKGVGKLLMQACMDTAAAAGYTHVWLGVWEHNARAIAFYRKWGFEKFSEHPFILGDDVQTDWLMRKTI